MPTLKDHPAEIPCTSLTMDSLAVRNEVIFHVAQLDFSRLATLRQPPSLKVALALADEILTSGFITNGDPILVTFLADANSAVPGPWPQELEYSRAFIFGYVKGASRLCTLHTLITLCFDDDISIEQAGPRGVPECCGVWWNGGGVVLAMGWLAMDSFNLLL